MKKRKLHEMRDKMQKIYLQFDRKCAHQQVKGSSETPRETKTHPGWV